METRRPRESGVRPETREKKKPLISGGLKKKLAMLFLVKDLFGASAPAFAQEQEATPQMPETHEQKRAPRPHLDMDIAGFQETIDRIYETKAIQKEAQWELQKKRVEAMGKKEKERYEQTNRFSREHPSSDFEAQFNAFPSKQAADNHIRSFLFGEIRAASNVDAIIALDELRERIQTEVLPPEEDAAEHARAELDQKEFLRIIGLERDQQVLELQQEGVHNVEGFVKDQSFKPRSETDRFFLTTSGSYIHESEYPAYREQTKTFRERSIDSLLAAQTPATFTRYNAVSEHVDGRVPDAYAEQNPNASEKEIKEAIEVSMRDVLFSKMRAEHDPLGSFVDLEILMTSVPDAEADAIEDREQKKQYRELIHQEMSESLQRIDQVAALMPQYLARDIPTEIDQRLHPEKSVPAYDSPVQERLAELKWDELLDERRAAHKALEEGLGDVREVKERIEDIDAVLHVKEVSRRDLFRQMKYEALLDEIVESENARETIRAQQEMANGTLRRLRLYEAGIDVDFRAQDVISSFDVLLLEPEEGERAPGATDYLERSQEVLFFLAHSVDQSPGIQHRAMELQETNRILTQSPEQISTERARTFFQAVSDLREAAEVESAYFAQINYLASIPGIDDVLSGDAREVLAIQKKIDEVLEETRKVETHRLSREEMSQITGGDTSNMNKENLPTLTQRQDRVPGFKLFTRLLPGLRGWSPAMYFGGEAVPGGGGFTIMLDDRMSPNLDELSRLHADLIEKRTEVAEEMVVAQAVLQEALVAFDEDVVERYNQAVAQH